MTITARYVSATFPKAWKEKEDEMIATLSHLIEDMAGISQTDQQIMLVILIGSLMEDFDEFEAKDFIQQFSEALHEYTDGRRSYAVKRSHAATSRPN